MTKRVRVRQELHRFRSQNSSAELNAPIIWELKQRCQLACEWTRRHESVLARRMNSVITMCLRGYSMEIGARKGKGRPRCIEPERKSLRHGTTSWSIRLRLQ